MFARLRSVRPNSATLWRPQIIYHKILIPFTFKPQMSYEGSTTIHYEMIRQKCSLPNYRILVLETPIRISYSR